VPATLLIHTEGNIYSDFAAPSSPTQRAALADTMDEEEP